MAAVAAEWDATESPGRWPYNSGRCGGMWGCGRGPGAEHKV